MVASEGICLENISFRIGEFAIEDLSLSIGDGEYFVLTGPNGSGKTILVKLIAGLLHPVSGRFRLRSRPVTHLPPWERNVGYVPQDGVLFPNMPVRGNIAHGLAVRGAGRKDVSAAIGEIASLLGIDGLLGRAIGGLSGGEKQKVALARALVFKPAVLLLDEPLSAIDEEVRDVLCGILRKVQRETGVTTLHVAHSRSEMDLVADRVGVLVGGRLRNM